MTVTDELAPRYAGWVHYLPDHGTDPDLLLVGVPCLLEGQPPFAYALLDTGSPWSLLPAQTAEALGYDLTPDPRVPALRTGRCGTIRGRWEQIWVRFPAQVGVAADLLVTFYLSPDWTGPLVIGWKGCLEGMRIALDPGDDRFYFALL